MMSNPSVSRALYALAVIANFVLTSFAIQLGAGRVPIPEAWEWITPLISAAVTGALMFLPRAGAEHIAQQVDILASQGVRKRDMVVLEKTEAEACFPSAADEGRGA